MKIAIIHEWLAGSGYSGAERVTEQILEIYPEADLFATVEYLTEGEREFLNGRTVTTSVIQKLPFARRFYRQYLPLAPLAVEQYDLSPYDLVISISHAVAKGVLTGPDQVHISYVLTPMRYAWDLQTQYLRDANLTRGLRSWLARWMLHKIRLWDASTASRVDHFVANSKFVSRRIQKNYRRSSVVIHPPVNVEEFKLGKTRDDFYLTVARLVPYKKVDVVVEAFARLPERRLIVIGSGPGLSEIRKAAPRNVTLMGYQPFEVLRDYMQRARGFVFAATEDFGISPVEAMACGTPIIGLAKGGLLETVIGLGNERPTGVFFDTLSPEAICDAVIRFEKNSELFSAQVIRENALRFSASRFRKEFRELVEEKMGEDDARRGR